MDNFDQWMPLDPEIVNELTATSKAKNAMSGLEETLNIAQGSTPMPKGIAKTIRNEVKEVADAVLAVVKSDEETFEDKIFIQTTIKTQIIKVQSVLDMLEGTMMIGTDAKTFQTYSDMSKTVLEGCKTLMSLQKQVEMSMALKAPPEANNAQEASITKTETIKVKGGSMNDFLAQLRGSSQNPQKSIDA